jgi:hypothetical protein
MSGANLVGGRGQHEVSSRGPNPTYRNQSTDASGQMRKSTALSDRFTANGGGNESYDDGEKSTNRNK